MKIVKRLQEAGFEALIAGGAVRDALLGRVALDLDIATSAEPDQVEDLFPNTVAVGKAFGVVRVIDQGHSIEVATYRLDQIYKDGRRPESVTFTSREEDAKRRDFTVNALFYDIITDTLYDDVNGLEDLNQRQLRAVGDPMKRFCEDELRRLRLFRFVSQLGFKIESQTWQAVTKNPEGLQRISRERITEETFKMWKGSFLPQAFNQWLESGLASFVDVFWKDKKASEFSDTFWKWRRQSVEEVWAHYFLFFWWTGFDWKESLPKYRLPKALQQVLLKAYNCFLRAPDLLEMSWGEQRLLTAEPLNEWVITAALDLKADLQLIARWQELREKLQKAGPLPAALIKGADLLSTFQGPKLGQVLDILYLEQLNQDWTRSEQALEWLRKQSKLGTL